MYIYEHSMKDREPRGYLEVFQDWTHKGNLLYVYLRRLTAEQEQRNGLVYVTSY